MVQLRKRAASLLLAVVIMLGLSVNVAAAVSDRALTQAITDTAAYMYRTVRTPQVGSIGGEWAVIGLARSGSNVPEEYYQDYYAAVEKHVKACKGVLHEKKYTEYSRVIVALSAIGADARDVAGYDLTYVLGDYDKTIWQGVNGPVWALIALDCRNYPMPRNEEAETQATRQLYIDRILECQLPDGGWSLSGTTSDPDVTGMALQALAKYQDQPAVKRATQAALVCISQKQNDDGGFGSWDTDNVESCVQVIVALCELGISLDDPRFVKNGKTVLDNLMTFYLPGNGFRHTDMDSGGNQMASEQAFYGLVAAQRAREGKNSLYRMGDAVGINKGDGERGGAGLEGKHADVKFLPVIHPGITFGDVTAHQNQSAIEALAARGVVAGYNADSFGPDDIVTRAQFAAIVVKALGLAPKANSVFDDVPAGAWYASFVGTAYTYGIVSGTSAATFSPDGVITRQEAATMVAHAAALCGMDTDRTNGQIRDVLAQFGDYMTAAEWARGPLAFCYGENILDQSVLDIKPHAALRRCEVAQMMCNLLGSADLM